MARYSGCGPADDYSDGFLDYSGVGVFGLVEQAAVIVFGHFNQIEKSWKVAIAQLQDGHLNAFAVLLGRFNAVEVEQFHDLGWILAGKIYLHILQNLLARICCNFVWIRR